MKNKDYKKLILIKDDVELIKAIHIPTANSYLILDEAGFVIEGFTKQQLISFINGELCITDSTEKTFNYTEYKDINKPSTNRLKKFLNLQKDE